MQIHAVTDAFRSLDNAHGGGLIREAVIGQLVSTASLVENTTYTEEVRRKIITGIGDLATVAGWMCHDVSMHITAQHYSCRPYKPRKRSMTLTLQRTCLVAWPAKSAIWVGRTMRWK